MQVPRTAVLALSRAPNAGLCDLAPHTDALFEAAAAHRRNFSKVGKECYAATPSVLANASNHTASAPRKWRRLNDGNA